MLFAHTLIECIQHILITLVQLIDQGASETLNTTSEHQLHPPPPHKKALKSLQRVRC